ncbi:MAG: protein kinase [Chitinivibrionales bacterium]|nr:protein kinase [Chitinivibrionales bacterium]
MNVPVESTNLERHTDSPAARAAMPMLGQKVGQNRILELIAEGGMANVYKTWHEGLEVVRAIKILKPGFSDEARDRLQTEAKISANLHHPNIVEIYVVDFWEGATPYIEMEYVEGASLKELLQEHKRLPVQTGLAIGYFICKSLQFAHNQVYTLYGKEYAGLVHRDIKPANILVSRGGIIKLADFGIAKPLDVSLHTVGTKVMGTFAYLSPEQLNGENLDLRSDLYALGAVLYEMFSGKKAFPQQTLAELVNQKTKGHYLPLQAFDQDFPRGLTAIIDKCLCLDRAKRFGSAAQLGKELLILLKKNSAAAPQEIITAFLRNPAATTKIRIFSSKPKLWLRAAVIIASLGLLTAAILFFGSRHPNPKPSALNALPAQTTVPPISTEPPSLPQPAATFSVTAPPPAPSAAPAPAAQAAVQNSISRHTLQKATRPLSATAVEKNMGLGRGALEEGQYNSALAFFQKALGAGPGDAERAEIALRMLDAAIGANNPVLAESLAVAAAGDDGYYYLLKARLLYNKENYAGAAGAVKSAFERPSRYAPDVSEKALFLWAQILEALYRQKPNLENKRNFVRAYQKYAASFCGETSQSENCATARDKTAGN